MGAFNIHDKSPRNKLFERENSAHIYNNKTNNTTLHHGKSGEMVKWEWGEFSTANEDNPQNAFLNHTII